jgi:type IV secretory pathway VirB2 component (pilin)
MNSTLKQNAFFILTLCVTIIAIALIDAQWLNHAIAQTAADPFAKVTTKGTELSGFLKGKIAIIMTTIVIIVVGMLMLMSRISHLVGVRILIGAILIGAAGSIAEWAYT